MPGVPGILDEARVPMNGLTYEYRYEYICLWVERMLCD
jgi:hypothetical protein